jgi:site-specific DNA recombinase
VTGSLMCGGSRSWRCWQSIGFDGAAMAAGIADAITAELYRLEGLDGQLRELVGRALREGDPGPERRMVDLERAEAKHRSETANVQASMKAFGPLTAIGEELRELEATGARLARERTDLERCQRRARWRRCAGWWRRSSGAWRSTRRNSASR